MGRPLGKEYLESMEIKTSKGYLSTQVGYSKYRVKESLNDEDFVKDENGNNVIVKLAEVAVEDNDVVVELDVLGEKQPVTKIMRNIMETAKGFYPYKLSDEGLKFEIDGITLSGATAGEPAPEEVETPVVEPVEE